MDAGKRQHSLFVLQLERQMGGDGVGQAAWVVNAGNRRENFRRNFFVELDVLVKLLHHGAAQRFNFAGFDISTGQHFSVGLHRCHIGGKMQFAVFNLVDPRALLTFDQHLDGAIWQLEHLKDGGNTTDFKHVGDDWIVFGSGFLRHQHDAPLRLHRGFKRLDALGAADKQGDDHVRKHHHIAQRQKR